MKLNYECLRDVILLIEDTFGPSGAKYATQLHKSETLSKYSLDDVVYSVIHLRMSGLIWTNDKPANRGLIEDYAVRGLTPEGHAFADKIREPSGWSSVKEGAKKLGAITITSLVKIALDKVADLSRLT